MPNWCDNTFIVSGDNIDDVTKWQTENTTVDKHGLYQVDFNGSVPMPDEEDGNNWYTWSLSNWGTKWNACYGCILESIGNDNELRYNFDTAWGPPREWFITMSAKYPKLNFAMHYSEPGMCFAGTMTRQDGYFDEVQRCDEDLTDDDKEAMGYTPCEACGGWEEECMCD
jgi:hypothetical protein